MANQSVNIREAFKARPGYYYCDPDYSQIEFRISAAIAGERDLLKGFLEGADYYKAVYATMCGKKPDEVTPAERKIGKVLALGQQYDQGDGGLARKLKCDVAIAKEHRANYWAGLASTARAKEDATNRALQCGYVTTWFGFKRYLPDLYSDIRRVRGKGLRSVWSTIIQGTAANWMKIAMLRCWRALRQAGRDVHLILTVHDEILFEISEKEPIREIEEIIREAMEFKVKTLPVAHKELYPDGFYCPVNFEYGYDWGNLCESIEEFQKYCDANGKTVNFDQPRPDMPPVSFVAVANNEPRVVIEPRKKPVDKSKNEVELIGCGGLDPVDAVLAWAKGEPPPAEHNPQPVGYQTTIPDIEPAEAETEDIVLSQELPDTPKPSFAPPTSAPPGVPMTLPDIRVPGQEVAVGEPTHAAPITPMAEAVRESVTVTPVEPPPSDEYAYPCIVIEPDCELDAKKIAFFKALLGKFPGEYWVYLDYKGKTVRAGTQVDPTPKMLSYLKKGFGPKTSHAIHDSTQAETRGKINFV